MQGGDTRFKKGHKSVVISERICLTCGNIFSPRNNRQRYCGGHSDKSGCSWKYDFEKRYKATKARREKKIIADPNYIRKMHLKRKYNLTQEEYTILSKKQGDVCGICKSSETGYQTKYMYVDHNHETGKVRGLLCNKCNFGLGNFKDQIELLKNAIKYLRKNS